MPAISVTDDHGLVTKNDRLKPFITVHLIAPLHGNVNLASKNPKMAGNQMISKLIYLCQKFDVTLILNGHGCIHTYISIIVYSFVLQLIPLMGQSILLGYLSQYFCEKNSLEEELSALRTLNNSVLVGLKEKEMQTATRNAYLYAIGIALLSLCTVFSYTWTFYYSHIIGMMHRVVMIGAIYSKVCV